MQAHAWSQAASCGPGALACRLQLSAVHVAGSPIYALAACYRAAGRMEEAVKLFEDLYQMTLSTQAGAGLHQNNRKHRGGNSGEDIHHTGEMQEKCRRGNNNNIQEESRPGPPTPQDLGSENAVGVVFFPLGCSEFSTQG